jgi:hypothetical protein
MILYGRYLTKIQYEIQGSDCSDCANKRDCKKWSIYNLNICNNFEYYVTDEDLKENFKIEIDLKQYMKICDNAKNNGTYNSDDELRELIKSTHDIPNFNYEEYF